MTSALWPQLLTFVFTVFGGVLIFIFSQAVLKLVIEPVQQLKAAIGQTANTLLLHQAKIGSAVTDEEIVSSLKAHAAELISKAAIISRYKMAKCVFGLPTQDEILSAAQELNLMAYGMMSAARNAAATHETQSHQQTAIVSNATALPKIGRLLKVKTTYG